MHNVDSSSVLLKLGDELLSSGAVCSTISFDSFSSFFSDFLGLVLLAPSLVNG